MLLEAHLLVKQVGIFIVGLSIINEHGEDDILRSETELNIYLKIDINGKRAC